MAYNTTNKNLSPIIALALYPLALRGGGGGISTNLYGIDPQNH
jgi:hypothetical protein